MITLKNPLTKVTVFIILVFIAVNNFIFFPNNILSWDVFGYYLYLPLKFIYHNVNVSDYSIIGNIVSKYHNTATFYQGLGLPDGTYVMKYSMGLSIFYSPFFFIGHLMAHVLHYPADGFSMPYQVSVFIGGIIYSIIGIIVLSKVLLRFLPDRIVAVVLLIVVFATNYIVHNTMYGQNALSHNILFTTYSLILWFTIRWHETHKAKFMVWTAIFCGLTILSRPSDVVCLIIPFFWGVYNRRTFTEKINLLWKKRRQVVLFVLILAVIGSFQVMYWKSVTGKFLYYSYGGNAGEGFEFFTPYFAKVLFSFRKGWFIYTPVMLFAVAGLVVLFRRNATIAGTITLYFIINLYIVSSWSCWWYAQSFGQRALIQSYPAMAIALGYFLLWLTEQRILLKSLFTVLIVLFAGLNIFQTAQFNKGIISGDRMTRAYYFAVFGRMHVPENADKLLLISRSFTASEQFTNEADYTMKVLADMDFEHTPEHDSAVAYSGRFSFRLDSTVIYSPAVEVPYSRLTKKDHAWIRVTANVYPITDPTTDPFSLIVHFTHNGYAYKYRGLNSEEIKPSPNQWTHLTFDYLTPEVRRTSDNLKVYFWLRGKAPVYVDDLRVEVFEEK